MSEDNTKKKPVSSEDANDSTAELSTKEIEETLVHQAITEDENNKKTNNEELNGPVKENKDRKKKTKKSRTIVNIILTALTITVNVFVAYILIGTSRFSSVSSSLFTEINVIALIALLVLDVFVILTVRIKKIALIIISFAILIAFSGTGGYAVYAVNRINKNVNKITTKKKEENVTASLVIYSGTSGDPITSVKDLNERKVGVSKGSKTEEIAKNRFESEGVTPQYVELNGYQEVLSSLITGKVDCAVMTTSYATDYEEDPNLSNYLKDTSSLLDFSDTVTTTSTEGADKDITKEPFTVLVTGENQGLADSIILMSVNPVSMKITMSSIPRDSFVPISCWYGGKSKINSAHASSEECMVNTVENVTGVDIDYTIEFNFASVIQVVDAVGGVDVDISTGFDAQCWDVEKDELVVYHLDPGENVHLDGTRALGFVRERYAFPDGDFARQRHQQEVIEQVVEKIMATRDPNTFLKILDAAGDNIKTNFTVNQMTSFINYALSKSKRYYNQDDVSGLFDFVSSRYYGSDSSVFDPSLGIDLYTYELSQYSIQKNYAAIERNLNLNAEMTPPVPVTWNASETYEVPDFGR